MSFASPRIQKRSSGSHWAATVPRLAGKLAHGLCLDRRVLALLAGAVTLNLLVRTLHPLGLVASSSKGQEPYHGLRWALLGWLTLLILVRAASWGTLLRGLGNLERVAIVAVSGCYLHCIGLMVLAVPDALLDGGIRRVDGRMVGDSLTLTSLAAILTLSRLDPRTLGSLFVVLAWCVPALCMPEPAEALSVAKGISIPPWSADGILPMLVPQLLALGYVSLERAQR
jgi:hypothetical protein